MGPFFVPIYRWWWSGQMPAFRQAAIRPRGVRLGVLLLAALLALGLWVATGHWRSAPRLLMSGGGLRGELSVLLVFYGLFWSALLGSVKRFKVFDTARLFDLAATRREETLARLLVGVLVLNVAPILWLLLLIQICFQPGTVRHPVVSGAVAALSVLGFNRICGALLCSRETWRAFYGSSEDGSEPEDETLRGDASHHFVAHLIGALLYLVGLGGVAFWLAL